MKNLKIGLALGGGGARGGCHIGVLKVLLANGIVPDVISGTSIGALVGGLFVSGMSPEEIENMIANYKGNNFFDVNFTKILKSGLIKGKRLIEKIEDLTHGKLIEDCKIKFFTTSVDLLTGNLHRFSSGRFADAIYPSLAIPLVFAPFEKDGMFLVDGGLVDNIPEEVLKAEGCDVIISVDAMGEYSCFEKPKNSIAIGEAAINLMIINNQNRNKKKIHDVKITPKQNFSMFKFWKEEMQHSVEAGEKATQAALSKIKKIIAFKTLSKNEIKGEKND